MGYNMFTLNEQQSLRKFWRNKWVARLLIPIAFPALFAISFGVAMCKGFMEHTGDLSIIARVWKRWEE